VGHRTKPDAEKTIVFEVVFVGSDPRANLFEMEWTEAEEACTAWFQMLLKGQQAVLMKSCSDDEED